MQAGIPAGLIIAYDDLNDGALLTLSLLPTPTCRRYVRGKMGSRVVLHLTPEYRFEYDDSIEEADLVGGAYRAGL